jgi:hypothetical protein
VAIFDFKSVMRKLVVGVLVVCLIAVISYLVIERYQRSQILEHESELILEQVDYVSKLIVTEARYAKVYTYKDTDAVMGPWFTSTKRALIVSNAKAQIAYDLKKLQYELDLDNKILKLGNLPEAELTVDPDIEFYNLDEGVVNKFTAKDLNLIKRRIKEDYNTSTNSYRCLS